jgi:hypothetical protein
MNRQSIRKRLLEGHDKGSLAAILLSFIYLIMFFVPVVSLHVGSLDKGVPLSAEVTKTSFFREHLLFGGL